MGQTATNHLVLTSAQTLTNSYALAENGLDIQYGTSKWVQANLEGMCTLEISYTTGAAETNNVLDYYIEFGTGAKESMTWAKETVEYLDDSANTITEEPWTHNLAGAAAATTYTARVQFPITAAAFRVYVKETGVAANYGTVTIKSNFQAGAGKEYNRRIQTVTIETGDINLVSVGGTAITLGQKTSANSIPVVLPSDAAANSGSASSGDSTYMSPRDFTAVYASGTTLTLSGLSFTPTSAEFASVKRQDTTGVSTTYTPDVKAFSYNPTTGVLTVTGAAFTATDVFVVTVLGPQKMFTQPTDSKRTEEISPLNQQAVPESWVDTAAGVGAGPTYYPSADGKEMTGIKSISFTGKIVEGDAENNTITVEGTNDEDSVSTNRDWSTLYGYRVDTDTYVNSFVQNVGTGTFAWDFDNCNYKYVRVKFIGGASATNTLIIKARTVAI